MFPLQAYPLNKKLEVTYHLLDIYTDYSMQVHFKDNTKSYRTVEKWAQDMLEAGFEQPELIACTMDCTANDVKALIRNTAIRSLSHESLTLLDNLTYFYNSEIRTIKTDNVLMLLKTLSELRDVLDDIVYQEMSLTNQDSACLDNLNDILFNIGDYYKNLSRAIVAKKKGWPNPYLSRMTPAEIGKTISDLEEEIRFKVTVFQSSSFFKDITDQLHYLLNKVWFEFNAK